MPRPNEGESKEDFIKRYMDSEEAKKTFPDEKQRYAAANGVWKKHNEIAPLNFNYNVAIEESGTIDSDFIIAGTAINATITSNNHQFLPEVLKESADTLIGVPLLVDHENKVENIKGRVFYAGYDELNKRVPFKAKVMDNKIKEMIRDKRLNSVSVGATVDPKDIEEGENGCLIPRHIVFRELSLVAVPADQGATFSVAMNQAYQKIKEDYIQNKSDSIIERREKMSETDEKKDETTEAKEEPKAEEPVEDKTKELINSMMAEMTKLKTELAELKTKSDKKEEIKEKVEVKEVKETPKVEEAEIEEDAPYKILQGSGSLRGGSFTLIKTKY